MGNGLVWKIRYSSGSWRSLCAWLMCCVKAVILNQKIAVTFYFPPLNIFGKPQNNDTLVLGYFVCCPAPATPPPPSRRIIVLLLSPANPAGSPTASTSVSFLHLPAGDKNSTTDWSCLLSSSLFKTKCTGDVIVMIRVHGPAPFFFLVLLTNKLKLYIL